MIKNCKVCELYQYAEVGDSDYGAIYSDKQSCEKELDLDENEEELLESFDRDIQRDCCILDFFKVSEIDDEIKALLENDYKNELYDEIDNGKAFERFKEKYR